MKKSKRLLSLVLALTMVFSLMGNAVVTAWADDEPQPTQETVASAGETTPTEPTPTEGEEETPGAPAADPADPADPEEPAQPTEGEEETPVVTPVPTRKEGYPAETSVKVKTGTAYLLADLQYGRIFEPVDGKGLKSTDYYYERSTDGGETWSPMTSFADAMFGMTTIQVTENVAGVYTYRFYASYDGVNFSTDTWTLILTVEDDPTMNYAFYVSQDYTGGYPTIKLYNVTTDAEGNEVLGDEIENVFLYSNFTDTLPEGETEYDPANGQLVSNYQMFYASLNSGRYAYRAFTTDGTALGGMTLELPTDSNVDGGAGGGSKLYLQCNSFYTTSRKTDNTYFTADEYHVRVTCPIMKCDATMGEPYVKGNYTYYPTVLYAAGNACLYNTYAYPDIDGYIFSQSINQTYTASYRAGTRTVNIATGVMLDVTVPSNATFGLYFQWNNFNTTEVAPVCADEEIPFADRWTDNKDGTKTAQYFISKGNSNYTWRLSDDTHVTQAGWLTSQQANAELTFGFADDAATDRLSHDFSNLGSVTINRDEADLQINLDPTGFEAITGTTRVRAYRHWQLINSDAANIMVEPDFHWNTLSGDADIATVNGGNTTANWADITPGAQDSVIAVYYDSVDVNPGNHGSHGGLYPATNPERVGVIVVGGTGVTHGTADADVDFNIAPGATTTRSADWDYNYDTWFYEAGETNPALNFAVTSTGDTTVEYAFVTTDSGMTSTLSGFSAVTAGADGRYTVPLNAFNTAGTNGGTVIIKMTDATGVSYRLVRVAKVAITAENASNPGEDIMPGDQVKLSFKGMYRAVNKISGIFNPTTFKPTYYAGETKFEGTLGQYQKMDNATVTVTIPTDVTFADGASTTEYTLTNGYTFGSMYSAANPFAFLYNMTDTGVGTNFNAVIVTYYLNHYADAAVTVARKVTFDTKLVITDDSGKTVDNVTVTLLDRNGNAVTPNEDGTYTLGYGPYSYTMSKDGYVVTRGSFSLGSADADKVKDGVLTLDATMPKAGENAWDGTTKTEPAKDDNGVYQIGTAAELAWFAATDGKSSAKLTADIDLASHDWTPMSKLYGTLDGNGYMIKNLYVNSKLRGGIFEYLKTGAAVMNLGVSGEVTGTATQAGGIAAYVEANAAIANCYSAVDVTSKKHAGGIAGYTAVGAIITNCYASGKITTTSTNECYLGGICGTFYSNANGATLTNCYSIGTVTGSGGTTSYVGGLTPSTNTTNYVDNCFYLENTVTKESPKYGITGLGTAKTVDEMKSAIEANDHPYKAQMLADLAVIAQEIADKAAAKAVDDLIDAIGDVTLTDDCKAKIDAARKAYDELTDTQKELVNNLETLTAAEAAYEALVNQAAAKAVDDLIDAIGDVTLTDGCKAKIDAARKAYDELTDAQKELVSNLEALTAAETQYKKLADDRAAADDVIDKINAIGKVTKKSGDAIKDARDAYDALTDDQKALISDETLQTLIDAEKRYRILKRNENGYDSGVYKDLMDGENSGTDAKADGKDVKSQNTGDDSHMALWLGGALLSAAALAVLAKKRRQDV